MREKSVVADKMRIDWDVPIEVDDGTVLRADVYRPVDEGQYAVLLTYGPYGKGLPFQTGYPDQWRIMCEQHPDVEAGSTCGALHDVHLPREDAFPEVRIQGHIGALVELGPESVPAGACHIHL